MPNTDNMALDSSKDQRSLMQRRTSGSSFVLPEQKGEIARGAEAVITKNGEITKERIKKGYRLEQLDIALRRKRNRAEASLLREARRAGVPVPQILAESDFSIKIEFMDGMKVKDALDEKNCKELAGKIAVSISKLHDKDIIHGDLTTSNMILKDNEIYFIDFGLGFFSEKTEDKATDLYLLHEALESTHFSVLEKAWETILNTYKEYYNGADKVIKTLAKIEKRGRYRER